MTQQTDVSQPRRIIFNSLCNMKFEKHSIKRALKLYEKHYNIINIGYDMTIIKEIIFRLNIKDKLKKSPIIYHSKVNIKQALEAMDFSAEYMDIAIEEYENSIIETSSSSLSTLVYNIEMITKLIMKLRADNYRAHQQQQQQQINKVHEQESNSSDSVVDIDDDHHGYLWKQSSKYTKKWQKRWFLINKGELQYFKDKTVDCIKNKKLDYKKRKEYIGNVAFCKVNKINIEKHKYVLSVTTSSQRTYLLKALNINEYDKWFYILNQQTKQRTVPGLVRKSNRSIPMNNRMELLQKIENDNRYCADCNQLSPQWVSINIGVILCFDCCAIHRDLGCHVTKMRSLILDDLNINILRCIVNIGGNIRINNQLLEYNLSKSHKINYKTCTMKQRSDFIHFKYIKKLYINDLNNDMNVNQYLFKSVVNNDCFGIIFALFNDANIDEKYEEYNNKTALQEAILQSNNEAAQLLMNNDAMPILQI